MDILEIMKERHSVRQYKNQAIEPSKREEINSLINNVKTVMKSLKTGEVLIGT